MEEEGAERLRASQDGENGGEGGGGLGGEDGEEESPGDVEVGPQNTGSESDCGCSHWLISV